MASSKLPAIQFYPGDWRKDVGVQALSFHDRGVWFEILLLMHGSEQRGVLTLNGKAMTDEALARVLGLDKQTLTTTLTNILDTGVASRNDSSGALMSRRMVRDEDLRAVRAKCGKLGGNPILKGRTTTEKDKQTGTSGDKQKATPSSSVSTSTTKAKTNTLASPPATPAREVDSRHASFRTVINHYWRERVERDSDAPWDGGEARHLSDLLKAYPTLTVDVFTQCLRNRAASDDVQHSERPRVWLSNVMRYRNGPLDRFNKAKGVGNGSGNGSNAGESAASARNRRSSEAIKSSIDRFRTRPTGSADGADEGGVSRAGDSAGYGGRVDAAMDGSSNPVRDAGIPEGVARSHGVVEVLAPSVGTKRAPRGDEARAS
jgi:hypothetical protein